MVTGLLAQCEALGVTLAPGDNGALRITPPGVLSDDLKAALKAHKSDVLKLLTAPEADCMSAAPCPICESHERWVWLDGRHLCRVCLILDLAPLTLLRQGWPEDPQEVERG